MASETQDCAFASIEAMQEELHVQHMVAEPHSAQRSRFQELHDIAVNVSAKGSSLNDFDSQKQRVMTEWYNDWRKEAREVGVCTAPDIVSEAGSRLASAPNRPR